MELKQKSGMYVQCSWCKRWETTEGTFVVAFNVDPSKQITHTCCPECMVKFLEEIRAGKEE
jgi:hypothetical protein